MSDTKQVATKASKRKWTRFVWTDYSGVLRCKTLPNHLSANGMPVAQGCIVLMPWIVMPKPTLITASGEFLVVPVNRPLPDANASPLLDKLISKVPARIPLPWHPNHAVVIGKKLDLNGKPWEFCSKFALLRAVGLLADRGLIVQAGFELEFGLFTQEGKDASNLQVFGRGSAYGLFDQMDVAATFLDDVAACLEEMGIPVTMVHAEGTAGQFEVVLGHKPVLQAVQDVVAARMAIRAVARRHGLVASFVPNYGDGLGGNGCHANLSLEGHFGVGEEGIRVSSTGQQFMAGIVDGLRWLTFLCNSSCLSYLRLLPKHWVGAYQVWGVNNKEAAVRLAADGTHVEVKGLDSVSEVDAAVAGILLAGLRGVEEEMVLPEACQVDPHVREESVRRLPRSLEESLGEFEAAGKRGVLKRVFADKMAMELCNVKRTEIEYVKEKGITEYRRLLMTLH